MLIVIVLLGILATITVFAVQGITDQSRNNADEADLRTLKTAVESYYALNQANPADEASLAAAGLIDGESDRHDYALNPDGSFTITNVISGSAVYSGPAAGPDD